jgi:hypothetical protein
MSDDGYLILNQPVYPIGMNKINIHTHLKKPPPGNNDFNTFIYSKTSGMPSPIDIYTMLKCVAQYNYPVLDALIT